MILIAEKFQRDGNDTMLGLEEIDGLNAYSRWG